MKTSKQLEAVETNKVKKLRIIWSIAIVCLPVMIAVIILTSALSVKEKITLHHHGYNSYDVRDAALFVAMPLLNATIK